jgi:hypothetical protein
MHWFGTCACIATRPQLLGFGALEQIADCASPDCPDHRGVIQNAGERNHLGVRQLAADGCRRGEPVHDGHEQVHQDHVRPQPARLAQRLGPIPGVANKLDATIALQESA